MVGIRLFKRLWEGPRIAAGGLISHHQVASRRLDSWCLPDARRKGVHDRFQQDSDRGSARPFRLDGETQGGYRGRLAWARQRAARRTRAVRGDAGPVRHRVRVLYPPTDIAAVPEFVVDPRADALRSVMPPAVSSPKWGSNSPHCPGTAPGQGHLPDHDRWSRECQREVDPGKPSRR